MAKSSGFWKSIFIWLVIVICLVLLWWLFFQFVPVNTDLWEHWLRATPWFVLFIALLVLISIFLRKRRNSKGNG